MFYVFTLSEQSWENIISGTLWKTYVLEVFKPTDCRCKADHRFPPPYPLVTVCSSARIPVIQESCIPLNQRDGELLEQLPDCDRLFLPRVARQRAAKLLDFTNCRLVPM